MAYRSSYLNCYFFWSFVMLLAIYFFVVAHALETSPITLFKCFNFLILHILTSQTFHQFWLVKFGSPKHLVAVIVADNSSVVVSWDKSNLLLLSGDVESNSGPRCPYKNPIHCIKVFKENMFPLGVVCDLWLRNVIKRRVVF